MRTLLRLRTSSVGLSRAEQHARIQAYAKHFLEANTELLEQRIQQGRTATDTATCTLATCVLRIGVSICLTASNSTTGFGVPMSPQRSLFWQWTSTTSAEAISAMHLSTPTCGQAAIFSCG